MRVDGEAGGTIDFVTKMIGTSYDYWKQHPEPVIGNPSMRISIDGNALTIESRSDDEMVTASLQHTLLVPC